METGEPGIKGHACPDCGRNESAQVSLSRARHWPLRVAVGGGLSPPARPLGSRAERWRMHLAWEELVAGAAVLVLVFGFIFPGAYSSPTLRAVVETIMSLFALAAAALVCDQFLHTRRLWKLLLLSALVTLALTEFLANALPAALDVRSGSGFTAAVPFGQLIAAGMLLATARIPSDRLVVGVRRPLLMAMILSIGSFAFAELSGLLLRGNLVTESSSEPGIHGALQRPLGFVILLLTAGVYVLAAGEFGRRARDERNSILPLLTTAVILLAAARLYYLALPWVSPETISLREVFRLLGFGFIFAAVLRRHLELRGTAARAAAIAERWRVVQDLHDGLAQDLAFIAAQGANLAEEFGDEHPLTRAARNALAISRNTIRELSDATSTSSREMLEAIGYELAARFGLDVVVDASPDATVVVDARDQIGRIVREAIANAAQHGKAQHILVSLKRIDGRSVLRVVDDGRWVGGPSGAAAEGFGIRSMHDRASALGGSLTIRPAGVGGTQVEVVFP